MSMKASKHSCTLAALSHAFTENLAPGTELLKMAPVGQIWQFERRIRSYIWPVFIKCQEGFCLTLR